MLVGLGGGFFFLNRLFPLSFFLLLIDDFESLRVFVVSFPGTLLILFFLNKECLHTSFPFVESGKSG